MQVRKALSDQEAATAAASGLSYKLAALDATLNVHMPLPAARGSADGGQPSAIMLHQAFCFQLPAADGVATAG